MSMKQALSPEEMKAAVGGAEDPIIGYTVRWQDAAGNEYSYTVSNRRNIKLIRDNAGSQSIFDISSDISDLISKSDNTTL